MIGAIFAAGAGLMAGKALQLWAKDWAGSVAGKGGLKIYSKIAKSWADDAVNMVPFVGPFKLAWGGISGGLAETFGKSGSMRTFNTSHKNYHIAEANKYKKMKNLINDDLKTMWYKGGTREPKKMFAELNRRDVLNELQIGLRKSMSLDVKDYKAAMKANFGEVFKSKGLKALHGESMARRIALNKDFISGTEKARDAARHAFESQKLLHASLISNAAVVAFPALSSTIMTVGITKALANRSSRRMRGYDVVY